MFPPLSFRQHYVKVPTYSTNRGLSKNAIKKVVILIGSKDSFCKKSLTNLSGLFYCKKCKKIGMYIKSRLGVGR